MAISYVLHIFYCHILVQKQNFRRRISFSHQGNNPITGLDRPCGAPGSWGKLVSPKHRQPLPPGGTRVLISVREWVVAVLPEGLRQWKIRVTPIGNRNRDLPAFSALPQPTARPRTTKKKGMNRGREEWRTLLPHSLWYLRSWSWHFETRLHAIQLLSTTMNDDVWHPTARASFFFSSSDFNCSFEGLLMKWRWID